VTADVAYFHRMYERSPDPWGFTSRWYDQRKYQLTLAALPRPRYRSAYEPGCSVGVLSALLAPRCDRLLCSDLVPAAVDSARARLREQRHVSVVRQQIPQDWSDGPFDLIVLSEVLYYLTDTELKQALECARHSLVPGGDLVAVHWRYPAAEHRHTGDAVHAYLSGAHGLAARGSYADPDFRLDVFTRADSPVPSVAAREGLVDAG
jgi:SAM-dependent methyltransferase